MSSSAPCQFHFRPASHRWMPSSVRAPCFSHRPLHFGASVREPGYGMEKTRRRRDNASFHAGAKCSLHATLPRGNSEGCASELSPKFGGLDRPTMEAGCAHD
ncbi:hypothetical protein MRX96_032230 [Rhipicephalus microplus]